MLHPTNEQENPRRRCPLRRFRRCRPDCAWFGGTSCAAVVLAQEAFALVEEVAHLPERLQPPDEREGEPCETS